MLVRFLDEPSEQVRAAQTNLLCNLRSVDGIDGDVVLSEIALNVAIIAPISINNVEKNTDYYVI